MRNLSAIVRGYLAKHSLKQAWAKYDHIRSKCVEPLCLMRSETNDGLLQRYLSEMPEVFKIVYQSGLVSNLDVYMLDGWQDSFNTRKRYDYSFYPETKGMYREAVLAVSKRLRAKYRPNSHRPQ